MTRGDAWIAGRMSGAPAALRTRAVAYLEQVPADGGDATRLAAAARLALDAVLRQGRDRSAALDLLAADSLVTLALLAQATSDPAGLDAFAAGLVGAAAA